MYFKENWQSMAEKEPALGHVVVATARPSMPFFATMPATMVANAAVGPAICTLLPPRAEMRKPATMAVYSPCSVGPGFFQKIPASLIAVVATAGAVKLLSLPVNTIGDLYTISSDLPRLSLPSLSYDTVAAVLPDAFTPGRPRCPPRSPTPSPRPRRPSAS